MPTPAPAPAADEAVRVVVQARPLLPFESAHGAAPTLHLSPAPPSIRVARPLAQDASFTAFDAVYAATPGAVPDELYDVHVAPLVDGLFAGLNATVFAYGQTSAGKSYTMHHVTARVAGQLFTRKREAEAAAANVTVRVGFVEIYCERIRDLVDGTRAPLGVVNVQVRERRSGPRKGGAGAAPVVFLDGARERCVTEESDLMEIIREGALVRQTASTGMNASSSRSHSIITITVQQEPVNDAAPTEGKPGLVDCLSAKLHLVDLAGSERAKRTNVEGERFAEGVEINKGLFALAKVISTLADNASSKNPRAPKAHVPYRDSKLTRLLQDSLGGNARTLLVACVSPADTSREETLGTLRYAERAKCIKNRPKVNTEANSVEVSDLRAALARARAEIASLAAENERLRSCIGASRRRRSSGSRGAANSGSARTLPSIPRDSITDSSRSPQLSPDPLIVIRDDDDVRGLKFRIAELEGMLDRANLSASDREALLGNGQDSERVTSRSPLGKLKNVGLAALNHVENSDSKKRSDAKSKSSHGPRRRLRTTKPQWNGSTTSSVTLRNGAARTDPCKQAPDVNRQAQVDGRTAFAPQSTTASVLLGRDRGPYRLPSPTSSHEHPNRSPAASVYGLDNDGSGSDVDGTDLDSSVMNALSASRLSEMRRTFMHRLKQAEADKASLDKQRIQLVRKLSAIQKQHEKEVDEIKANHHVRVAGMRARLADVKRLEAESTRLLKLRDGSDAARKKLVAKVKTAEKARDDLMAKLAETLTKAETVKKALGKENRDLAKSERQLRAELRRCEIGKNRQDAMISRLRMENDAMKNKLRDAGRPHVRRVNSSITPSSTVRRTTTC